MTRDKKKDCFKEKNVRNYAFLSHKYLKKKKKV